MYMDYTKLWKLLLEKGLTKTDLMKLTGISSRVIAKLSKNETVTTDTLAKICSALTCDVTDIMACVADEAMTLYQSYKRLGSVAEETELYKVITFEQAGQAYRVYLTKRSANKGTHLHCRTDGSIVWEQLYALGGGIARPGREEYVLMRPKATKDEIAIVVIKGKPAMMVGIDDHGFVSQKGTRKSDKDILVMTEASFKLFQG